MADFKIKVGSIIRLKGLPRGQQGVVLETDWETGIANIYWFKTKRIYWNYFGVLTVLVP